MENNKVRTLVGTGVGNFFEWLDFTIYGFFSTAISLTFFPGEDEVLALVATIGAFAIGFLTRPLGAYVMGRYADTIGRTNALVITFAMMGLGTVFIVAAPSYQAAGAVGAVCVLLGRLLQGFAASGEYGAAAAQFLEVAPDGKKGRYVSLLAVSTYLALAAGALLAVGVYQFFGTEAAEAYGWRYAFIIGLFIIPLGMWVRVHMSDSEEFKKARAVAPEKPGKIDWRAIMIVIGFTSLGTSSLYLSMIFMPSYAKAAFDIPVMYTSITTSLSCAVVAVCAYLGGWMSDRAGPVVPTCGGLLVITLGGLSAYLYVLSEPMFLSILLFQLVNGIGLGFFVGGSLSTISLLFLTSGRALGMGLGYNLGVAVFGAFAPIVSTAALSYSINYAPALYIAFTSVISMFSVKALLAHPAQKFDVGIAK
ncbi:MFS transporter [Marinobacter confluentis]|uniref:MFS transporter n=1 Tax=Marinobacter confluentis TaxID=1697557 RepID=A0A4Z1C9Y5_9GAMM|nr:MFS transporter [Marinobacter confluentis]TGN40453.1 MFS transporter [Marinobacter confluentis]